jgi:hypothetical protein
MSEFFNGCWMILKELYHLIDSGGYLGCGIAFVISVILLNRGVRITGREASYTGWISQLEMANLKYNPPIEGTARTWVGRLIGNLMILAGAIVMTVMFFALIHLLLLEIAKPRRKLAQSRHPYLKLRFIKAAD